jgi:aminoglycoside phosphotransferase (APT) family kinase protein
MPGTRPAAEVKIDARLVRRLLAAQFPQWAGLPLKLLDSPGWDNTIYRLGADLAVRLPRRGIGAGHIEKEQRWLPMLASRLPLAVPVPLGKGVPGEGYPWHWTVSQWLPGDSAANQPVTDQMEAARALAQFVAALQAIDPMGGPGSEFRGVPPAGRDRAVRATIEALHGALDPGPVIAAWESAVAAPVWRGPAVWMHGDLHPANLLTERGRLTAVIDFGLLAVGDPACDLMVAWTFLSAPAREALQAMLPVDDATWARARGWALDAGLMLAAHSTGSPVLGGIARHTISEVLSDYGQAAWLD